MNKVIFMFRSHSNYLLFRNGKKGVWRYILYYIRHFLIFLLIIASPFKANAILKEKLLITTTISPISSLASMIAGDKAEISTILSSSGCPHHYFLKPSDLEKMDNSDLFIYIDEDFDVFARPLLSKFNKDSIKISSLDGIKIIGNNLHLWLLPENAIIILKKIASKLSEILPEHQLYFQKNLEIHIKKMHSLSVKRIGLKNADIVLLSDSAEYLFYDIDNVITQYQSEYSSVKSIKQLRNLSLENRCFIISLDQDIAKYQKLLGNKIVSISTENWQVNGTLESLYYREYEGILHLILSQCAKVTLKNLEGD